MSKKTLKVGICEGRHQMPCAQFVFATSVAPADMVGLQATADAAVAKFAHDGVQKLELFVTGLTVATLAVVSAAVKAGMAVTALGFGFRCGFLGLLHMDVLKERLEREDNLALITTAPNVIYEVIRTNGDVEMVDNPSLFPDPTVIDHVEEPYVNATIIVPKDYVGAVMELSQEKRGEYDNMTYLDDTRVMLHYELPLSEIIFDYFDRLKSISRGYASLDYELHGYKPSDLAKVDILLNGDPVDALSAIVHRERAQVRGRALVE